MTEEELDDAFREVFPIRASNELASLEYVGPAASEQALRVVIRLIGWQMDEPGVASIRDVKEQELYVADRENTASAERVRACLRGLARVLAVALTHAPVETLMPHDLLILNVLRLARAQTEDDFAKALSTKARLGRYLPANPGQPMTGDALDAIFRAAFPIIAADGARLDHVSIDEAAGCHRAVMRLHAGGRDVEQAVVLMAVDRAVQVHRLEAYVRALCRVLPRALAHPTVRARMPADLVDLRVLGLSTAHTEDDFVKALSAKSRLGRLL